MTDHSDDSENVVPTPEPVDLARKALGSLVQSEPERHPLVIALVSPLGTPLDPIVQALKESLARFDYATEVIRLSQLLDAVPKTTAGELPRPGEKAYYEERMNAGDALRSQVGNGSALAALAVGRIAQLRESRGADTAYVLRSLKHPDEEALLRQVYGDAFTLVAVSSTAEDRREELAHELSHFEDPRAEAERLIARDAADQAERKFGQNVRQVFSFADAYVPTIRGVDPRAGVDRYVGSLFGAPFLTPRFEEEAMRLAADASLRSAALGRQVGAALIPAIGTPIVVGTNEVPKPGGGQYWVDDVPDHRDFRTGNDPNPLYAKRVVQEILEKLAEHGWLIDDLRNRSGDELFHRSMEVDSSGQSVLKRTRAADLIEFTRCIHAEQAAIINSARAGVSTQGAILFTTTFPCHECTKMIVGAGITEVSYIDPYPKSLADRLYRDLIDTEPPTRVEPGLVNGRVPFRAFQGIAPRRYDVAFKAGKRRIGDSPAVLDRQATPRTSGWSESAVRRREDIAVKSIEAILSATPLQKVAEPPSPGISAAVPESAPERLERGGAPRTEEGSGAS